MNTYEFLGISLNEGKIYEALVEKGEANISEIAVAAKIHRRNAYDAINRLVDKGLCFQIITPKGNLYNAVDPDKLLELMAEHKDKLEKILPDLKKKFKSRVALQEAYIYRGLEGQKNIFRDMLRVGEDSYFIGAKGGWYDSRIEAAREAFFRGANRKGIKFIQLFEYAVKEKMPDFPKNFSGPLKYRFLPKDYETNSAIHIFGNYVITYTGLPLGKITDDTVFFVLHSKDLAESYRKWFWYMWQQSEVPKKNS
ncbi:MAG: helix-turn-helix domain-containing protein [bacterium]|nr:helix-turn-helix domain-containing protein [bacterium]